MSVLRIVLTNMTDLLLRNYEGALVGALVGDCMGSPFEFNTNFSKTETKMNKILKFFKEVDEKEIKINYTDDTAMLKSVAKSLLKHNGFDAKDLSKRFAEEYLKDPGRGYGGNIPTVFKELEKTKYEDPFGPASKQFNGGGSYGNGGAMRIAPAALFALNFTVTEFNNLVENITRVTHSHREAINGATLEATAVQLALKSAMSDAPFTRHQMIAELQEKMSSLETPNDEMQASDEARTFCEKLKKIEDFIQSSEPTVTEVVKSLGHGVSAIKSVPTAVYSFLRTLEKPAEGWEKPFNPFERTIIYSISLGGDTDTIASMAGAIAGAYYGVDSIPKSWQKACEGLDRAKSHARKLFSNAKKNHS